MVRSERPRAGRARRIGALLEAGDHRAAAAEARRVLSDGESADEARRDARAVLASLRPDPGAVAVGAAGLLVAVSLTLWRVLGALR